MTTTSTWIACEHPEQPPDPYVVFEWGCRACALAVTAVERRHPDDPVVASIAAKKRAAAGMVV